MIVVDKPSEWTSHDVVNKMRRIANTRKVGHLGTLDPSATGVLPLVIGRATRLAQFYTRNDKVYEGVVHFGYSTDSYDGGRRADFRGSRGDAGPECARIRAQRISRPVRTGSAGGFGEEDRGPAGYYGKLARKHQPVDLKPVPVEVYSLDVLA